MCVEGACCRLVLLVRLGFVVRLEDGKSCEEATVFVAYRDGLSQNPPNDSSFLTSKLYSCLCKIL